MVMPETAHWVAIIIAALTGGFAKHVFDWLRTLGKGSAERRTELKRAWEYGDGEARKRRIVEEHASCLRRIMLEATCIEAKDIPPFPYYTKEKQ